MLANALGKDGEPICYNGLHELLIITGGPQK